LTRPPDPPLIAIDGLPCSGKSTLADKIQPAHGFECVYLDDFVLPDMDWPTRSKPAFPFEFIRYREFIDAVTALASTGRCIYAPFDWQTLTISKVLRTVTLDRPVIVEGVSSLNPILSPLYGVKIFVASDRKTALEAAERRGAGTWTSEWRNLFMPSADIYMNSNPTSRADWIVRGRVVS
jgi:uridine kinase